jgi:UDP-N-acetylmuramate--alanine ligase
MSGYARAAHALGASVSGSDRAETPFLERLREEGVLDAHIGHDPRNLPVGDDVELIYSSAVAAENPERLAARERGIADRPRAELLAELSALRRTIAVAGAHGKTTTASMIVHVLREAGADPGWLVGSSIGDGLANSHWSAGEWLVIEADESDRSMLSLHVEIAVLTNVELDHHATFASLGELREVFREFLARSPTAVIWDRADLRSLRDGPAVYYDAVEPSMSDGGATFDWRGTPVSLSVPGAHNALNATAALEVARLAGIDATGSIGSFYGAGRRFERLGQTSTGAELVDDYAHHPTEVAATLRAARTLGWRRLVAVFQPHLYSRTAMLAREFGQALALADVAVVLDVYPARERREDHPGVSGLLIAQATAEAAAGRPVYWLPSFSEAEPVLRRMLGERELCVVMGAGDVDGLARRLVDYREQPAGVEVRAGAEGEGSAETPQGNDHV